MPGRAESPGRPGATPTGPGIAVVAVGTAAIALGLTLGLAEITGLGIAMLVLAAVAAASVVAMRPTLRCDRSPGSSRSFVDHTVRVEVHVTHTGTGRSHPVRLVDPVSFPDGRTTVIRRTVRPLAPGETDHGDFGLRSDHRGLCTVGPMRIEATDPFGLFRRTWPGPAAVQVTVLPRIEPVVAPAFHLEADTPAAVRPATAQGTEFASLREYTRGDDLRKVHWRTSARRDDLVVRRDTDPVRPGCTVLLDVRRSSYDAATFERAVSAAASIVVAAAAEGQAVRLCTTDGFDSARGAGRRQVDVILGLLAVLETGTDHPRGSGYGPDPIVVLTTARGAVAVAPVTTGSRVALVVRFDPSPAGGRGADAGGRTLDVPADRPFADAWNRRSAPPVRSDRERAEVGPW